MKSPRAHRKTTSAALYEPSTFFVTSSTPNLLEEAVYVCRGTLGSGDLEDGIGHVVLLDVKQYW
jgi:hypothetical protein